MKNNNKVAVAGCAVTGFTKLDHNIDRLFFIAVKDLFKNTPNLSARDVDTLVTCTNEQSNYMSNIVCEYSGLSPRICYTVESLCSSGASGIVSAYSHIAAGLADVAVVVGAERLNSPGAVLEWDKSRGMFNHPVHWASLFTSSYKREFGISMEDLAYVSANDHRNAFDNRSAYFYKKTGFSLQDIMNSKKLTEDLRLYDCSMPCCGSASLLLTSEQYAKKFTDSPVWISGIGQKSLFASFTRNSPLYSIESTRTASNDAYQMAGIQNPSNEVDVAEIHDAFSVCQLMELEDLGIVEKRGGAAEFVKEMYDAKDNKINPRGGLIGAGHPLAATGVAQTAEVFLQLQGKAGKRQVDKTETGLIQNMSAGGTSSTVLVLSG